MMRGVEQVMVVKRWLEVLKREERAQFTLPHPRYNYAHRTENQNLGILRKKWSTDLGVSSR
jgi:hypothetical protein